MGKFIQLNLRRQLLDDRIITGLDIGTSKVSVVIAEINDSGVLEIIGVGNAPCNGLRRGVVVNIEATVQAIIKAVEDAELMSGREIRSCFTGIAGANIEGINSRGVVAVSGKNREISEDDINRVVEAARAIAIPMDREILHVIPQSFIVDDQKGIKNPLDMIGVRLEAEVHIITGSLTTTQNLVRCINRAGFSVDGLILQTLASSKALLTEDEKELGSMIIDLGGGTTDALLFVEGAPYFSASVGVGGIQVTNDLSIVLKIPLDAAERIKKESGTCYLPHIDPGETVIIPGMPGKAPSEIPRINLAQIMQPRMEEIILLLREKIITMNYMHLLKGGIVLTGGGAKMNGVVDLVQEIFNMPVRVGVPSSLGGLTEEYQKPEHATAVGLVLMGAERHLAGNSIKEKPDKGSTSRHGVLKKISDWFKEMF
ncbi:MAG TPA: cell division protein FtsA [Spirochaetia bacterium]|nr:cell division protein FtsA [Spirochaetales bacterium]HRS65218.1 cell division protein FtsA [Spirochaetia bacterium]